MANRGFVGELVTAMYTFARDAAATFTEHRLLEAVRITDWTPYQSGRKRWRYRWVTDGGRVSPFDEEFAWRVYYSQAPDTDQVTGVLQGVPQRLQ